MNKESLIKALGQEFFDSNNLTFRSEGVVTEFINGLSRTKTEVVFSIKNNYKKPYAKSLAVSFYIFKGSKDIYCRGYFNMPPACDLTVIMEKIGADMDSVSMSKITISSIAEYTHKMAEAYLR